jgi:mono/diheme cytochrome c family protein
MSKPAMAVGLASALTLFAGVVAVFGHGWMAPKDAASRKNPLPRNSAVIQLGRDLYTKHCAECHGTEGRGDGPKASSTWPAPMDLRMSADHPAGDTAWKIENGRGDMPAFKEKLSSSDIWSITHWLSTLSK